MEGFKLNFEADTLYGVYRDALLLPIEHSLTEDDIKQMMQDRVTNWVSVLAAQPAEELPAEELPQDGE